VKLETLRFEVKNRVATVALHRPEVRNAFHPAMVRELTELFVELSGRTDLTSIILMGEGKSFSSGADLEYMKTMAGFSVAENLADAKRLDEMFWAIYHCSVPLIGRIHGHAIGGGVGLVSLCDVSASVAGTVFSFSEVRLGLAPAVISPYVLEKMNRSQARRYMLSGEIFDAQTALESRLVDFVGSEVDVDAFVSKMALAFDQNGAKAVRATKSLIRHIGATADWKERRTLTTRVISELRAGDEGQEGLRAFLEKREPKWKPKGGS
jgi:methylglutaconyl-CoA hydratase